MVRFVVVAFCWLVLIALCRLTLERNGALPDELQQNAYNRDETQPLLQRIGAHYGGEHVFGGFEIALISPIKSNRYTLPRSHCVHDGDAQVWAMRDDGARWQGCDVDGCAVDVEGPC